MKIRFMGAARTVTGSCYILEAGGHRFAIDCGMHQGNAEIEKRNWDVEIYDPGRDRIHAHDPRPHGPFGAPAASRPEGVPRQGLRDAAHAGPPADHAPGQRAHPGDGRPVEKPQDASLRRTRRPFPLYTQKDAMATFPLLSSVTYGETFSPFPELTVTFRDAGHILGAAMVELTPDRRREKRAGSSFPATSAGRSSC